MKFKGRQSTGGQRDRYVLELWILILFDKLESVRQIPICFTGVGAPKAPLVRGKRSAVAEVNDSPADCQSRDRTARRRLSADQRD